MRISEKEAKSGGWEVLGRGLMTSGKFSKAIYVEKNGIRAWYIPKKR